MNWVTLPVIGNGMQEMASGAEQIEWLILEVSRFKVS
jgi:hypothetical protein